MRKQYKSMLNQVPVTRDKVGAKEIDGFRLFERKGAIPLASASLSTARVKALRMWELT